MSRKTNDFGKDPVPVLVLKISIPFMFAQFVNVLYSIVDRIYIGNIPVIGDVSLAGAGVCAPIITLLSSFATLIGIGGSVLFSMRLGAGDEEKAKTILANSFSLLLLFSAALTVMFLLIKGQLLRWFGASETTWPYANTYLTIYTLGTFFALLSMGMNYFITAQGFPMLGMVTTLVGAVVNTILDPVFIFLFHMNIAGAALATVIAQLCSCSFVLLVLKRRNMPVPLTLVRPEKKLSLRIVKMGFSPFLILATDSIVIIALNAVLQYFGGPEYGDTLITCATIVQSYMLLITMPMGGMTLGTQPVVSFNYGAGQPQRIKTAMRSIVGLCVAFCAIMMVVTHTASPLFARLFTADPALIDRSVSYIKVFTAMILPLAVQYPLVDETTALGHLRLALFCSLFRKSLYFLALILLPTLVSAEATFFSEPIADLVAACVTTILFLRAFPKILLECQGHTAAPL